MDVLPAPAGRIPSATLMHGRRLYNNPDDRNVLETFWRAHEGRANSGAIAIVQWSHTLRMKPMLNAARRQIAKVPWAEHHIVLHSCGVNSTGCSDLLAGLHPITENVTCAYPAEMATELPALSGLQSTFHGAQVSRAEQLEVGTVRWCWNACDASYIHWYKRIGIGLTHVRFFWFLEWDVVWTGNIAALLATWNALSPDQDADVPRPNSERPRKGAIGSVVEDSEYDLLCPNPGWAHMKWVHRQKRDETLVPINST